MEHISTKLYDWCNLFGCPFVTNKNKNMKKLNYTLENLPCIIRVDLDQLEAPLLTELFYSDDKATQNNYINTIKNRPFNSNKNILQLEAFSNFSILEKYKDVKVYRLENGNWITLFPE